METKDHPFTITKTMLPTFPIFEYKKSEKPKPTHTLMLEAKNDFFAKLQEFYNQHSLLLNPEQDKDLIKMFDYLKTVSEIVLIRNADLAFLQQQMTRLEKNPTSYDIRTETNLRQISNILYFGAQNIITSAYQIIDALKNECEVAQAKKMSGSSFRN